MAKITICSKLYRQNEINILFYSPFIMKIKHWVIFHLHIYDTLRLKIKQCVILIVKYIWVYFKKIVRIVHCAV